MKELMIMRHAKSSWKDSELSDHERPLNKRGKKDAPLMGKKLKKESIIPQIILSSSAVRCQMTVEALVEEINFKGEIKYLDLLYMAELETIVDILKDLPEDFKRVMLVGHNPGLEGMVQLLGGKIDSMPTAAIAYIILPIKKWKDLNKKTEGELAKLWRPRDVK